MYLLIKISNHLFIVRSTFVLRVVLYPFIVYIGDRKSCEQETYNY